MPLELKSKEHKRNAGFLFNKTALGLPDTVCHLAKRHGIEPLGSEYECAVVGVGSDGEHYDLTAIGEAVQKAAESTKDERQD